VARKAKTKGYRFFALCSMLSALLNFTRRGD
jgi:hypothetical protein